MNAIQNAINPVMAMATMISGHDNFSFLLEYVRGAPTSPSVRDLIITLRITLVMDGIIP